MSDARGLLLVLGVALAQYPWATPANAQISTRPAKPIGRHGLWMIQAAALRGAQNDERATRTAEALIAELRAKGLPAYAISTTVTPHADRGGAVQTEIVVIVGDYERADSSVGKKTLEYIRQLQDTPTVSRLAKSTREPQPLASASICRNPLVEGIEVGGSDE